MSGLEQILILTGLSGSGKSYAGRCLEDMKTLQNVLIG